MNDSTFTLVSLFLILGAHVAPALAMGNCLSTKRLPDPWIPCKNTPGLLGKWACESSKIDFPTVECLKKDMETCGNVGSGPSIFYSFGAATVDVRKPVRDAMGANGVMWNDALDGTYVDMLKKQEPTFKMGTAGPRQSLYVSRYAEAFASLSKGEVFFGVLNYNGEFGGKGAYQNVAAGHNPENNKWIQHEMPTLQHKSQATKITTYGVNDKSFHVDWERGVKGEMKPYKDSMKLKVPPATKRSDESSYCTMDDNSEDNKNEGDEEECEEYEE